MISFPATRIQSETEKFRGICEDNVKTKKRIGKRILLREVFDYVSKNRLEILLVEKIKEIKEGNHES